MLSFGEGSLPRPTSFFRQRQRGHHVIPAVTDYCERNIRS